MYIHVIRDSLTFVPDYMYVHMVQHCIGINTNAKYCYYQHNHNSLTCPMGSHNFKGTACGVFSEEHGKHVANGVYLGTFPLYSPVNIRGDSHAILKECSSYVQWYKTWVYNDQRTESRIATTGHHCSCHGTSQLEHAHWRVVSQIHSAIFDMPSSILLRVFMIHPW